MTVSESSKGVCLVVGAGDATGGAIARRFAREGFTACVTRRSADKLATLVEQIRSAGGKVHAFGSDARKKDDVVDLVEEIETTIGHIEVLVFNIGANAAASILEETARKYFKIWEMACFSGFLNAREVAKRMAQRQRGTILFTGATAGLRGASGFAAFAGAKHGIRALAQSMARELGPKNIHVGHLIIDSGVDTEWVRQRRIEALGPGALDNPDLLMPPSSVAESYWLLYQQPRSAWTFELEIRPFGEKW